MKQLALSLILVGMGVVAWRALSHDAPDAKLFYDRLWIDHQPSDQTEAFQSLWVDGAHPFGNFATRNIWTGQFERFHYHVVPREDGILDFLFGATNERQRVRYTARVCNEDGFDLCLELSGTTRGLRRYYSKKAWQLQAGDLDSPDALARVLVDTRR
jgi:hypothetical protein